MPDIVILTARFGNGHYSAAANIAEALRLERPDLSVEIADAYDAVQPWLYRLLQRLYRRVMNRHPRTWRLFFLLVSRRGAAAGAALRNRRMRAFFATFAERFQPKVVVTTYPMYSAALGRLYGDGPARPFRVVSVVTDSITIHPTWTEGPSDLYLVADELTAAHLVHGGIPAETVLVTGFAVPPVFAEKAQAAAAAAPAVTGGTAAVGPRILLLPNLPRRELFEVLAILGSRPEAKLVLSMFSRKELIPATERFARTLPAAVEVHPWIQDVSHKLFDMDLVVTKAGGALVHEAIAAACPMVLAQVTPGQEEGNARLVEAMGLGLVAPDYRRLRKALAFLRDTDFGALPAMRRNLLAMRRLDGARRIARVAASIAGGAEPPAAAAGERTPRS